jgi:hypothetical protein
MARVYNGFLSYRPFAGGYQTAAGLYADLAEAARRRWERLWLGTSDLRDNEGRWSRPSVPGYLPGSLFDARYEGLTADAAAIDAAIMGCRERLLTGVEMDHSSCRQRKMPY